MKKILIVVLLIVSFIKTEQIDIDAESFYADEKGQFMEFINATVTKKEDKLTTDKIIVDFDKKGQPLKYVASGNVKVKVFLNDKHYNASGETLTYEVKNQKYILEGDAHLTEIDTDRKVYGDLIEVDQLNGTYSVKGKDSAPAKFIFQIEDKR
jgi:lipopolysaccharide export system protein LptA